MRYFVILFIFALVGCGGNNYVTQKTLDEYFDWLEINLNNEVNCRFIGDLALDYRQLCAAGDEQFCNKADLYTLLYRDNCIVDDE